MKSRVSIIIPVCNKSAYIRTCIQSIQGQSLKELEIICVDDESTDGSAEILEELGRSDPRIRLIRQKNQGPGAARNRGLEAATGEYVHFMDADDYYMSGMALERLYHAAVNAAIKIVGGLFYHDDAGCVSFQNIYGELAGQAEEGEKILYNRYQYDFYQYNFLYKREFLKSNHLGFPLRRIYEDPPFMVRAMTLAEEFCIVKEPFYCYRWSHARGVFSAAKAADLLDGLLENLNFSAEHGQKKLHRITCSRINEMYVSEILCGMKDDVRVLQRLLNLNEAVKWEWLEEKEAVQARMLKPLEILMNSIRTGSMAAEIANRRFLFPFQRVRAGSRIALYGAGLVGREYYDQLMLSEHCELVLWIDKNAEQIHRDDYDIRGIHELHLVQWDYIVIALADLEIALAVWDDLLRMDVPKEKIVWSVMGNRR